MTDQTIERTLAGFRKHLSKGNKHANTIRSYLHDVTKFLKWLRHTIGEGYSLSDIGRADLLDFRSFLLTRRSSPTSVNRRMTALRQFFEYCAAQKLITVNPASEVSGVPVETVAPLILSRKDALLLLRTAERKPYPLDSCVLLLLLHCGMRSSEIAGLTIGDLYLNPREGRVFIRGQRGKTMRFVYLTTRSQAALKLYCKRRSINILARHRREEPLLVLLDGSELTSQYIDSITKRIGREAGIPHVTSTMLRNTCAIQALLNGESPAAVARMLGVASVRNLQKIAEKMKESPSPT